jgi:RNA polymerase sigma factor (sigma-70 family)
VESTHHQKNLPLGDFADDALVQLVQQCGRRHPAAEVLLLRHQDWVLQLVHRQARRAWLAWDETADAQQDALVAALEAMDRYDPVQHDRARHCSFRTFLWMVVQARWIDFFRKRRRLHRHLDRSVSVDGNAETQSNRQRSTVCTCVNAVQAARYEPEAEANQRELLAAVEGVLGRWPEVVRQVAEAMLTGKSLRAIARELAMPYHHVKRLGRRIRARLARAIPDWPGAGA